MTSSPFYIKQNDVRTVLRRRLRERGGKAIDLGSVDQVVFRMRRSLDHPLKVERTAVVIDPPPDPSEDNEDPNVEFFWSPGDTDEVGTFLSEFEIDYGGGVTLTVPNDGYMPVIVTGELD